jgi:hypothetical protein
MPGWRFSARLWRPAIVSLISGYYQRFRSMFNLLRREVQDPPAFSAKYAHELDFAARRE